jgi:hypothetical protein
MRFSDGGLDVIGSCRRSATPNALFKSRDSSIICAKSFWVGKTERTSLRTPFALIFFKSRLQLNHVPVHETHRAKVRKIPMTSKTPSLNRIVDGLDISSSIQGLGS